MRTSSNSFGSKCSSVYVRWRTPGPANGATCLEHGVPQVGHRGRLSTRELFRLPSLQRHKLASCVSPPGCVPTFYEDGNNAFGNDILRWVVVGAALLSGLISGQMLGVAIANRAARDYWK
jgi:hypothetical protein